MTKLFETVVSVVIRVEADNAEAAKRIIVRDLISFRGQFPVGFSLKDEVVNVEEI